MSTTGWIVLGVIVVIVLWVIMIYNGLVSMRQRVSQAFADIDVQLRQRHDLIPNLVETVKGYATHESGTFEAVTAARNAAVGATTIESPPKGSTSRPASSKIGIDSITKERSRGGRLITSGSRSLCPGPFPAAFIARLLSSSKRIRSWAAC